MTNERLYETLGDISDRHIKAAKQVKKAKQPIWLKWGALAACALVIAGISLPHIFNHDDATTGGMPEEGKDEVLVDYLESITTEVETAVSQSASEEGTHNLQFSDKNFPNWGIKLSVEGVTSKGLTLIVTQSGGNPTGDLLTGEAYRLAVLSGDTWKIVEELPLPEGVDARCWHEIAYNIPKEDVTELEINWEWIFGELSSGTYRLMKDFMDFRGTANYDTFEYWVEFTVK